MFTNINPILSFQCGCQRMIEYLLAFKTLLVETTLQKPSENWCQDKKLFHVKLFEFIFFSLREANH